MTIKLYQTSISLDHLLKTKSHLQKLLHARGLSHIELSRMTGIPRNTIQRWLSTNNNTFMTFRDAVVIAETLRVPVSELCPPPLWQVKGSTRHTELLSRLSNWPTEHIEAMADFYAKLFPGVE